MTQFSFPVFVINISAESKSWKWGNADHANMDLTALTQQTKIYAFVYSSAVPSGNAACQMSTCMSSAASSASSTLRGGGGRTLKVEKSIFCPFWHVRPITFSLCWHGHSQGGTNQISNIHDGFD